MKNIHQTINSIAMILTAVTGLIAIFDIQDTAAEREAEIRSDLDSIVHVFDKREAVLLEQLKVVKQQKEADSAEFARLSGITEQQIKRLQDEIIPLKRSIRDIGVLPDL